MIYANEADVLNVAMFGITAKLNQIAIHQMSILESDRYDRKLLK